MSINNVKLFYNYIICTDIKHLIKCIFDFKYEIYYGDKRVIKKTPCMDREFFFMND
jgi:hypothetical protein